MKTIQIKNKGLKYNKLLIKKLSSLFLIGDKDFHFFFEPDLIIRIKNQKTIGKIGRYLYKKKIEFDVYNYPKTKKGYGEGDRLMLKYLPLFDALFHIHSLMVLGIKTKRKLFLTDRIFHTYLNTSGLEWHEEAIVFHQMGKGRTNVVKKYEKVFPIQSFTLSLISFIEWLLLKIYKLF